MNADNQMQPVWIYICPSDMIGSHSIKTVWKQSEQKSESELLVIIMYFQLENLHRITQDETFLCL